VLRSSEDSAGHPKGLLASCKKSVVAQRRWERADVNLAVVCRSQGEILDDIVKKLGAGGMFMESDRPKPVGSAVELQFNLPGIDAPVQLSGRVHRGSQVLDVWWFVLAWSGSSGPS
jgi:hypothetical protein